METESEDLYGFSKPIRLSAKELSRADDGYTVVVRLQKKTGLYLVSIINIETRKAVFPRRPVERQFICSTIQDQLRMMDKCAMGGKMSDRSRHRAGEKYWARKEAEKLNDSK